MVSVVKALHVKAVPRMRIQVLTAVFISAWLSVDIAAQNLPAPSRTVYKCEVNGKISYSDEPCVGAQKIDVEPTRGVNQLSGKGRTGKDVRHEHEREMIYEAFRPLTGKDAKEMTVIERRMKLTENERRECAALDRSISTGEAEERTASKQSLQLVQERLYTQRSRFRQLGC